MKARKEYVPPRIVEVKLNQSQAVLSQCAVGVGTLQSVGGAWCVVQHNCRQDAHTVGDSGATS